VKLPSFQFYPGDWRKDPGVQSLTFEDRGIWFEILCIMHESEERGKLILNGRPMPQDALARLLGLDNQKLGMALTTILEFGVASRDGENGVIYCRRMVRDEKLRKIRTEAGKMGGNPVLVKQKTTTLLNQKPTPSARARPEGESEDEVQGIKEGIGNHQGGPGQKPASIEECLATAQIIGLPASDAKQWFTDCKAAHWRRGDGTPFDNWVRQMTIHRDNTRQNKFTSYGNNKNNRNSNPRLEGVHRPKTDYAAAAARKTGMAGQVAGPANSPPENPSA